MDKYKHIYNLAVVWDNIWKNTNLIFTTNSKNVDFSFFLEKADKLLDWWKFSITSHTIFNNK